jgi:effector-binding domain-containing protein
MKIKSLIKTSGLALIMGSVFSCMAYGQNESIIEIKNIESQKALIIKSEVLTAEIGSKVGELYGKLFEFMGRKNIQPAAAPFAVYYSYDPQGKTSFEVGCPLLSETAVSEGVEFKEYPAMKAVTTLYKGAYENMGPIYEKLQAYITSNNLKSTGIAWEVYLTDPKQVKDPGENKTIIYFPVE